MPRQLILDKIKTEKIHEHHKKRLGFWSNFAIGGIAAIVTKTLTTPIERVKLILQIIRIHHTENPQGHTPFDRSTYTNPYNTFMSTWTREGALSFWRGNVVNVLRYFIAQALNFGLKIQLNKNLSDQVDPKVKYFDFFTQNMVCGAQAGGCSQIFVYPLDLVRTRMAADIVIRQIDNTQTRQFVNSRDCFRQIYLKNGLIGFYYGFGVSLWGVMIYRGCQFGVYDSLKVFVGPDEWVLKKFTIASFSTMLSGFITYGKDTVKRRLMMQAAKEHSCKDYKSAMHCYQKIYYQEGIKGFYAGVSVNVLRGISGSICLVLFDEINHYIQFGHSRHNCTH